VLILGYHRASGNLRQHIRYLQRHYRILPLETALEELQQRKKGESQQADKRMPVVLTFDDGYYDNYTVAFALARELGFPFTVFLIPGYIEDPRRFWWHEHVYLASHAQSNGAVIDGRTYHLRRPEERRALATAVYTRAHDAHSVAERETFLVSTRQALELAADLPGNSITEDELARPLTWPEVHEMESSGWVSFGAHTVHHPVLAYLRDPVELRREVGGSREMLERQLGHTVHAFAYPMGKPEDIGVAGLEATREAGFKWGFTTVPGFNTQHTNPCALHRIVTDTDEPWWVLAAQAAGVWEFLAPSRLLRIAMRLHTRSVAPGNRCTA
jgi:peptidoglycan/xylan/chitin deacetylase (PgdA/CDA1 family)